MARNRFADPVHWLDLVARDAKGEVYTVRYEGEKALLLNEFLKEHRKVQELEAEIAKHQKDSEANEANQARADSSSNSAS